MPPSRTHEQGLKSVNASTHDMLLYIRPDADAAALVNMLMLRGKKNKKKPHNFGHWVLLSKRLGELGRLHGCKV